MSDDDRDRPLRAVRRNPESDSGFFGDMSAKSVASIAWIVVAVCYGFALGKWSGASINMASGSPYPPFWWFFLFMGTAFGIALSAWFVALRSDEVVE